MKLVKTGQLPFHAVTSGNLQPPKPGDTDPQRPGRFASPDALLSPAYMAAAAADPDIRIEPSWKVSIVYGMPCAIYHQLPAAYYHAARYPYDFESAVLHAVNAGGQNQARAFLTRDIVQSAIRVFRNSETPQRWLEEFRAVFRFGNTGHRDALTDSLLLKASPSGHKSGSFESHRGCGAV